MFDARITKPFSLKWWLDCIEKSLKYLPRLWICLSTIDLTKVGLYAKIENRSKMIPIYSVTPIRIQVVLTILTYCRVKKFNMRPCCNDNRLCEDEHYTPASRLQTLHTPHTLWILLHVMQRTNNNHF